MWNKLILHTAWLQISHPIFWSSQLKTFWTTRAKGNSDKTIAEWLLFWYHRAKYCSENIWLQEPWKMSQRLTVQSLQPCCSGTKPVLPLHVTGPLVEMTSDSGHIPDSGSNLEPYDAHCTCVPQVLLSQMCHKIRSVCVVRLHTLAGPAPKLSTKKWWSWTSVQ